MLRAAGVEPEVRVSGVDEEAITAPTPSGLVLALAEAKAAAVVRPGDDDLLVLGCDSMLDLDGDRVRQAGHGGRGDQALGADGRPVRGPAHRARAAAPYGAGPSSAQAADVAATVVRFGTPTPDELAAYVATGEPLQVAGAFTIDGRGGWFVEGVDGDPGTVIGLSLPLLRELLRRVGVGVTDLWAAPPPPRSLDSGTRNEVVRCVQC